MARIRVAVDGELIDSLQTVINMARTRGFTGCDNTIIYRIQHGATTWAELLAPVDEGASKGGRVSGQRRATRLAKEKELMAQLCAELDARKAAIKEAA
jgi:hypothetical protein